MTTEDFKQFCIDQINHSLNEYPGMNEAIDDAAYFIAEKMKELIPKWISVDDELPEESEDVLMHYEWNDSEDEKYFTTYMGHYYCGDWRFAEQGESVGNRKVTHWMPLPTKPNQ